MIKLIKTGKSNFFRNKNTGEIIYEYDPQNEDLEMVIKMDDGSTLVIDSSEIKVEYGGQISFEYDGNKYSIDDGYRDILIHAGYIVMDDYDVCNQLDKDLGAEIRKHLLDVAKSALNVMEDSEVLSDREESKGNTIIFHYAGFKFTVSIDFINTIVNKNQERKINKLPYYPFTKGMDKYGTLYLSIFCKRENPKISANKKYDVSTNFVENLIDEMNNFDSDHHYHFDVVNINKRIYNV